jgi:hypothetical protein
MKGLDETVLLIMSCRHGWVWRALNMFSGETYRHVLYLHEYAKDQNCRFFCYDVVCQYWIFLLNVTKTEALRERFQSLIEQTIDFLSRWHGKTHAWFCQVSDFKIYISNRNNHLSLHELLQLLHLGSYKKGAAATTGEYQEQNNAHTSRFVNTTKHMSKSRIRFFSKLLLFSSNKVYNTGRIDTHTSGFIKGNWGQIPRMVKKILKTYHTVIC